MYLRQLLKDRTPLDTSDVQNKLMELGIKLGEHPYKVFSVTYDGNKNEVEIFEDCFSTLEEAENIKINHNDYHEIAIYIEEDE